MSFLKLFFLIITKNGSFTKNIEYFYVWYFLHTEHNAAKVHMLEETGREEKRHQCSCCLP